MERRIAVVGLGCVGLPAAVAFGLRGKLVGFDVERAAAGFLVFGL
jgi:UDP-N-acetyl-D-galactosamine dehydrogenase